MNETTITNEHALKMQLTINSNFKTAPPASTCGASRNDKAAQNALRKLEKYPAKAHARKVAKELGAKGGLIYLPGAPAANYEDSDQGPPIRQRRYFYYLSGVNFADCHITYDIGSDALTLFVPYVPPRQVLWFGKTPDADEAKALYNVDQVLYDQDLVPYLTAHFAKSSNKDLYVLHANHMPPVQQPDADIILGKLQRAINEARTIKDDYEVAMIRHANDISSHAHRKIAENLLSMTNEAEIEAQHLAVCVSKGAKAQAYAIIAGAGTNAATLHYDANDQPLKDKDVVVVDAGCEWGLYASDITRSLPLGGSWEGRAAQVHKLVQKMQDECIARVRPGLVFYQLHLLAVRIAVDGLLELGVLRGSKDKILQAGTGAAFFPHGLGHHVGLEVHDVTGRAELLPLAMNKNKDEAVRVRKRLLVDSTDLMAMQNLGRQKEYVGGQILQPNMIVTVEPGIYFCKEYIEGYYLSNPDHAKFIDEDVLSKFYRVGGVRIEDDILVTEDGYENLTTAPKGDELTDIIQKGFQNK